MSPSFCLLIDTGQPLYTPKAALHQKSPLTETFDADGGLLMQPLLGVGDAPRPSLCPPYERTTLAGHFGVSDFSRERRVMAEEIKGLETEEQVEGEQRPGFPFTLEKIALELEKHEVKVFQVLGHRDNGFPYLPTIYFNGDEQDGEGAAQIVIDYGMPYFRLNRIWQYCGREGNTPSPDIWGMSFGVTLPRG